MTFIWLTAFAIVLLALGILTILQSSSIVSRFVDRVMKRFPRAIEFCFGFLFGVFIAFAPAAIVYGVTREFWASAIVAGVISVACGILWSRWSARLKRKRG